MRNFFERAANRLRVFMYGRYGNDELSRFLSYAALVFLFLSMIRPLRFLYLVAFVLLVLSLMRTFSKNTAARQKERAKYFIIKDKVQKKTALQKKKFSERKIYKYYKCPHCKAAVRIKRPSSHMKISITCPKCKNSFIKKI